MENHITEDRYMDDPITRAGQVIDDALGQGEVIPGEIPAFDSEGVRILMGVPCTYGMTHREFTYSFTVMNSRSGTSNMLSIPEVGDVGTMRNMLVDMALKNDMTHILFLDYDMVLHPNLVPLLARHKLPIVTGLYHQRRAPFNPLMYVGKPNEMLMVTNYKPGALIRVLATGCGATLIETEVFKQLKRPWFQTIVDDVQYETEDINFYNKCYEKGIPVYVDTEAECGHKGKMIFNSATFKFFRDNVDGVVL